MTSTILRANLRSCRRQIADPPSICPAWLRPLLLAIVLLGHALVLTATRNSLEFASPFDTIEITVATLGDSAEEKPELEEIKPAQPQAAAPTSTGQRPALPVPAPLMPEPQALSLPERGQTLDDKSVNNDENEQAARKSEINPAFEIPPQAGQLAQKLGATAESNQTTGLSRATYEGLLIAEFNRRKSYPAAARAAGITGSVEISFTVGPNGRVSSGIITRSSGNALLDAAARAMMDAVSAPPPPGGQFSSSTTIRFSLY